LQGKNINLVELPGTPFARAEPDQVLSTLLAMVEAMGPYGTVDPSTKQLHAQVLCLVPHHQIPLCLGRSYTLQGFWTDVIGQI
jgi:hypothetical protein